MVPPFQILDHFDISRFINFVMRLGIYWCLDTYNIYGSRFAKMTRNLE
jgi:hypothetical protein